MPALPLLLLACLAPQAPAAPGPVQVERRFALFGTQVQIAVTAADRAAALAATEEALLGLRRADEQLSSWREDSELSRLNRASVGTELRVGVELDAVLRRAMRWRDQTDGALEPAIGALIDVWQLRATLPPRRPERGALQNALKASGPATFKRGPLGWQRRRAEAWIDCGGFAKGGALDAALDTVHTSVDSILIDAGGQLAWRGSVAPIGIADPSDRSLLVASLHPLRNGSIATSGQSERGGHLLDPRTGLAARDFGSVTVVARSALDADCLATGLFVLGPDSALAFAQRIPGIEVVVAEHAQVGTNARVRATAGLRGRLHPVGTQPIEFLTPRTQHATTPGTRSDQPRTRLRHHLHRAR